MNITFDEFFQCLFKRTVQAYTIEEGAVTILLIGERRHRKTDFLI